MNRSVFLATAVAIGLTAGLTNPASGQVSTAVMNQAFGASGSTGAANAWDALKTGGGTTSITTQDTGGTLTGSQITETSATGGRVGTFTFSGSEGESQRFAVGTGTSIGANASASSTREYQVQSTAQFGFGGSTLRQSIGTSGISETTQARESAASSYAETKIASELGNSIEKAIEKSQDSTVSNENSGGGGWWWWYQNNYSGKSYNDLSSTEKTAVENKYNETKESLNTTYKSEYSSSSSATEAANGVISGSFVSDRSNSTDGDSATNDVTVKGVGNAANVNAAYNSTFNSNITARTLPAGSEVSNSATASGSAGGNVNTNASADASRTSFTSIFMQSF